MKTIKVFSPFLMCVLLGSVALAQAGSADLPETPQPQDPAPAQVESTPVAKAEASGQSKLISQARQHQRFPRRPTRRPLGPAYRSAAPMPGLSPIGALIGFGVGAALGASRSPDATASGRTASGLIIGAIGAVIGGVIGTAPFPHVRRRYPPPGPDDDDDESDLRSANRVMHSGRAGLATTAVSSQATRVEAITPPPSEAPAVP